MSRTKGKLGRIAVRKRGDRRGRPKVVKWGEGTEQLINRVYFQVEGEKNRGKQRAPWRKRCTKKKKEKKEKRE